MPDEAIRMLYFKRKGSQFRGFGETLKGGNIADNLPSKPPNITLRHAQVMWLLAELGFGAGVSAATFYAYVKSLRKLGIPFPQGSIRAKGRTLAVYSYYHVMELAITLSLRVYHVVPDSVLNGIIHHRRRLHRLYHTAYTYRRSGKGSPIVLKTNDDRLIELRGLFLDLGVRFSGGQLIGFGPPRLVSPTEALTLFAQRLLFAENFFPVSASILSERVVSLALYAPARRKDYPARHARAAKQQPPTGRSSLDGQNGR
jgi:hypothetical protein